VIPLLIRDMLPEEKSLILSDWKKDLWEQRPAWGRALHSEEWWALINHVVDRITLPTSSVLVAASRNEPDFGICWLAYREGVLHLHATKDVLREPELAAYLERALRDHAQREDAPYNPFLELKLWPLSR
jgi:hypothetical protein